jgi:hypothetical protein
MPGGIWEAIGNALMAGGQTYNQVSRQQAADRDADARLKLAQEESKRQSEYQAAQLKQLQDQEARTVEDRQRKILEAAIANAQAGDTFTPDQLQQAGKFGLSGAFHQTPTVGGVEGRSFAQPVTVQGKLGEDTSPETMAFLQSRGLDPNIKPQTSTPITLQGPTLTRKLADLAPQEGQITRRFTPKEQAEQAQQEMLRDTFNSMNGKGDPATGGNPATPPQGALTPEAKQRFGLSMIPGVNANEVLGPTTVNPFAGRAIGEDVLKGLSPQEALMVKKMANYDLPIPAGSMRNPQIMALMSKAAAYDPSFDATQYAARQKVRNDFTSGGVANNIQSLNTTLNHMAKLSEAAGKLNNFSSPMVNAPVNWVEQHAMGDERVNNYNVLADAVAAEAAKVFKGGLNAAPATQEINEWRRNLSPNLSPEQFKGSMQSLSALLEGRLSEIQQRWANAFGDKPLPFQLPSPSGSKALTSMGIPTKDDGGLPNGIQVVGDAAAQPQSHVATVAQVNAYAKAKGLAPVAAAKQLQAEGWTINGR